MALTGVKNALVPQPTACSLFVMLDCSPSDFKPFLPIIEFSCSRPKLSPTDPLAKTRFNVDTLRLDFLGLTSFERRWRLQIFTLK